MKKTCAAMAILGILALAGTAHAAYDPLGSGTTKLTLDKGFASFLKANGIELVASAGAKRKGRSYVLAVSGGNMDPTTGKGEVQNEGTVLFKDARKKVPLRNVTVKAKRTPLIAKVGGSQLKVAKAEKIDSKRSGFGTLFTGTKLRLTAKMVTRLNKKLRPKIPFAANQPLGTLVSDAQPRLVTILDQGKATISLASSFLAKLDSRFVSLNPIAPAERLGAALVFPIAPGGSLAPDGSEGTLRAGGALEFLQLGAGQVFWQELWLDLAARSDSAEVDIEPTPVFPGKIGRTSVLDLGTASVVSDPKARTISASDAPLALSAEGAARFNEAFAQGEGAAFVAGEPVGSLSFTAQGQ